MFLPVPAFPGCYGSKAVKQSLLLSLFSLANFISDSTIKNGTKTVQVTTYFLNVLVRYVCLQCFDTVGWAAGRASGL